jgi:uncharacterized RDD family membrane protein YckC
VNAVQPQYVGFWARFIAFIIDSFLASLVLMPLSGLLIGAAEQDRFDLVEDLLGFFTPANLFFQGVLPAIALILFWVYRQASPGKMAIGAKIVDATTLGKPTTGQMVGRYFAYYLSIFGLMLGFFWIGIDPRKQGWHDKLAGTVVIRK